MTSMNYACVSNRPFVTRKNLSIKKNLSPEEKDRREFIRSHKFSVVVDPATKKAEVKITKR